MNKKFALGLLAIIAVTFVGGTASAHPRHHYDNGWRGYNHHRVVNRGFYNSCNNPGFRRGFMSHRDRAYFRHNDRQRYIGYDRPGYRY